MKSGYRYAKDLVYTFPLAQFIRTEACIGLTFDYAAARALGKAVLSHYGHGSLEPTSEDLDAADEAASPAPA